MKKSIFLILLLSSVSSLLLAQPGNENHQINSQSVAKGGYTGDKNTLTEWSATIENVSEQLDSIVTSNYVVEHTDWLNKKKSAFFYEYNGKTVTKYKYSWASGTSEWSKLRRHIYTYDDAGNKTGEIQGLWQQVSSAWADGYKEEWAYNADGLLTLNAVYYWNADTEIWEGDNRSQYTYDDQGNKLAYVYSTWHDADMDFRNYYKQAWEYLDGNLIKYTYAFWNNKDQKWMTNSFVEYEYNNEGLKIQGNGYRISYGDTLPDGLTEWSYNEYNLPVKYTSYGFNDTDGSWYETAREVYQYDMYGNKILTKNYTLNSTVDSLVIKQTRINSYDENGNQTLDSHSDYEYTFAGDQIIGMDSTGYKHTFEYNNRDLLGLQLSQYWNPWSDPDQIFKDEYTYDESGNLLERSMYVSNGEAWDGTEKYVLEYTTYSNISQYTYFYWDDSTGDWVLDDQSSRGMYYYRKVQTPNEPGNDTSKNAFAPVGAEWYYDEQFAFEGDIDYIKFTVEKDTMIFGQQCKKITKRHKLYCNERPDTEYVYASNDTVYFLDTIFNEFQVLYVFDADPGESWMIKVKDEEQEVDTVTITVNSVSTREINGQNLRALEVTYFKNDEHMPMTYSSTIIEKIGDIHYMFNWYPWSMIACDGNYTRGLRCYQDLDIGLYSTGIRDSCDFTNTWIGIDESEASQLIGVFPNPARDFVSIDVEGYSEYVARLFDINGRLLESTSTDNSTCRLDLSQIVSGFYFVRVSNNNQVIGYRKLIVE